MDWPATLINIYGEENVRVTGKGVIDGNGSYWWKKFNEMHDPHVKRGLRWALDYDVKRVRPMVVFKSNNLLLTDFTVKSALRRVGKMIKSGNSIQSKNSPDKK